MTRKLVIACIALLASASIMLAQEPPKMPKPGPEHQRLHYFLGKWNYEFEMKATAGKVTGVDRNEMMPGGFFLVTHSEGKGTMGELKGLAIMGYDADQKVYTYHAFNNWGEAEDYKGTVVADTWTWTSEAKMAGKMVKTKFTLKEVSPTSYTMQFDAMGDDGSWNTAMVGKATKAK